MKNIFLRDIVIIVVDIFIQNFVNIIHTSLLYIIIVLTSLISYYFYNDKTKNVNTFDFIEY
jgi:hypothetical protein